MKGNFSTIRYASTPPPPLLYYYYNFGISEMLVFPRVPLFLSIASLSCVVRLIFRNAERNMWSKKNIARNNQGSRKCYVNVRELLSDKRNGSRRELPFGNLSRSTLWRSTLCWGKIMKKKKGKSLIFCNSSSLPTLPLPFMFLFRLIILFTLSRCRLRPLSIDICCLEFRSMSVCASAIFDPPSVPDMWACRSRCYRVVV